METFEIETKAKLNQTIWFTTIVQKNHGTLKWEVNKDKVKQIVMELDQFGLSVFYVTNYAKHESENVFTSEIECTKEANKRNEKIRKYATS